MRITSVQEQKLLFLSQDQNLPKKYYSQRKEKIIHWKSLCHENNEVKDDKDS